MLTTGLNATITSRAGAAPAAAAAAPRCAPAAASGGAVARPRCRLSSPAAAAGAPSRPPAPRRRLCAAASSAAAAAAYAAAPPVLPTWIPREPAAEILEPAARAMLAAMTRAPVDVPSLGVVDTAFVHDAAAAPAGAPPALLLHGFDSSSLEFRRLHPLLAPHLDTHAVDLAGWGFTDASRFAAEPERVLSPADKRAHLHAYWCQRMGRRPMTLVGASLGGAVAIDFALHHPEVRSGARCGLENPRLRLGGVPAAAAGSVPHARSLASPGSKHPTNGTLPRARRPSPGWCSSTHRASSTASAPWRRCRARWPRWGCRRARERRSSSPLIFCFSRQSPPPPTACPPSSPLLSPSSRPCPDPR